MKRIRVACVVILAAALAWSMTSLINQRLTPTQVAYCRIPLALAATGLDLGAGEVELSSRTCGVDGGVHSEDDPLHLHLEVNAGGSSGSPPSSTTTTTSTPCVGQDEVEWEQSNPSSRKLGENLGPRPPGEWDAHHIVAGAATLADEARQKLIAYEVDINDADNGLWLERTRHRCQHTNTYYRTVNDRLFSASSTEEVRAILKVMAQEIRLGTFPK